MATKLNLISISSGFKGTDIETNFTSIEDEFDKVVYRDGTSPNQMTDHFDLNSNRIVNLANAVNNSDAATLADVQAQTTEDASSKPATAITVEDASGYYAGANVEAVLKEIIDTGLTFTADHTFSGDPTFSGNPNFTGDVTFDPEHATDSATDTYVSATNTTPPADGVTITRDFQSANTTTTPTLDGKTMTTRDGSALWAGAVSGVHDVQYDSGADTYLVLEPIDAFLQRAPVVQHRSRINYHTVSSVQVMVPENLVMAGFRFMGSYRNGNGRYMSSGVTSGWVEVSETNDLAVEDTIHAHNWYAVFAVANKADAAVTFVLMPFFRAGTVSGSTIPFAQGGETDGDTVTTTTYSGLATNELAGADVLVIQEGKVFSGKTTTVASNTNADITLDTIGSVAANDFFLVAPPGWDDYVYLGSYYHDNAEPRNIADTGDVVGSYGVNNIDLPASGAIASPTRMTAAGQVSPLATALRAFLTYSLSTASTGVVEHQFYHDSSDHFVERYRHNKEGGNTITISSQVMEFPFSKEQAVWMETSGGLEGSISSRTLRTYGWIEP